MFGWFRRIRRINIFGFELEFDHPPETASPGGTISHSSATPSTGSVKKAPLGTRMVAHGKVIKAVGGDLGVRVENEAEIREFWRANQLDTNLDWFGPGSPVISIPAKYASGCKIGDEAAITLETANWTGGRRRAKPVAIEVRSRA